MAEIDEALRLWNAEVREPSQCPCRMPMVVDGLVRRQGERIALLKMGPEKSEVEIPHVLSDHFQRSPSLSPRWQIQRLHFAKGVNS